MAREEEGKALCVVKVAVNALAFEVILVVNEVVDDVVDLCLEDAAVLAPPSHRNTDAGDKAHLVPQLLRDAVIQGHHHPAANQPGAQRLGQRGPLYICQTARQ